MATADGMVTRYGYRLAPARDRGDTMLLTSEAPFERLLDEACRLRTKNTTHEIDFILEGADGQIVTIEVKLSATVRDHDMRHPNWLRHQIGSPISDRVIVTTGDYAYRRSDGVAVVPLALLGP